MGDKIQQIRKNLAAFLSWWADELLGIAPVALRDVLFPDEKTVQVFFREQQTEIVLPADGPEERKTFDLSVPEILEAPEFKKILSKEVNHPVTILLSEDLILERQINLPKAAKNSFRNIVRLQLSRLLPMAEQDIHFDCLSAEQDGQETIAVSLAMIKRSLSKHIISVFTGAGHRIKAIKGISGSDKSLTFTFLNLGKKYKDLESGLVAGLVAGFLVLTTLFTGIHYFQLSEREEFLNGKMNELSQDARAIEALSSEIQNFDRQQSLYQSKIEHLRLDEILSNLTDLLPDDSWVFEFAKNGDRLTITGKTSNASLLVEKIDNSPLFRNVTNSSTRINNPSGNAARERFSISFELEERGQND